MTETLIISASNSNAAMEAIGKISGVVSITYLEHIDIFNVNIETKDEALAIQKQINETVPGIIHNILGGKMYAL